MVTLGHVEADRRQGRLVAGSFSNLRWLVAGSFSNLDCFYSMVLVAELLVAGPLVAEVLVSELWVAERWSPLGRLVEQTLDR